MHNCSGCPRCSDEMRSVMRFAHNAPQGYRLWLSTTQGALRATHRAARARVLRVIGPQSAALPSKSAVIAPPPSLQDAVIQHRKGEAFHPTPLPTGSGVVTPAPSLTDAIIKWRTR